MKKICFTLFFVHVCLFLLSCNNDNSSKATVTDTKESTNEKLESITPDFRNYPQYVSCKIDGQPYVAYYADNHITGISNSLNIPSQVVFSTSADQVEINGETKKARLILAFIR